MVGRETMADGREAPGTAAPPEAPATAADRDATQPTRAGWWAAPSAAVSFLTVLPVRRSERPPAIPGVSPKGRNPAPVPSSVPEGLRRLSPALQRRAPWRSRVSAGPGTVANPLARAVALFPLVGAALGALLGGLGLVLDRWLPPGPVAALLLVIGAVLTGGLHLDGLLDTADGVFGGRDPEHRLAIMRDSRVGAFGAVAAVLAVLVQYACLAELVGTARFAALVVAYATSRWAMVLAMGAFPAARPDGLGAAFRTAVGRETVLVGSIVAVGIGLVFGGLGIGGLGASAMVALVGGRFLTRRLGGLTGDAYGALAVIAETVTLSLALALTQGALGT